MTHPPHGPDAKHNTDTRQNGLPSRSQGEFLDVKALAEILGFSVRTIWRYADNGTIPPPVLVGSWSVRWRRDAIEKWISQGCRGTFAVKRRHQARNKRDGPKRGCRSLPSLCDDSVDPQSCATQSAADQGRQLPATSIPPQ